VRSMRLLSIGFVALFAVGCSVAAPEHTVGPLPNGSFASCPSKGVLPHQNPELEALLPKGVNGRELTIWSISGWCWVDLDYPSDPAFARAASGMGDEGVKVGDLAMAVAGRSDTQQDPPYFVFAVRKSGDQTRMPPPYSFCSEAWVATQPICQLMRTGKRGSWAARTCRLARRPWSTRATTREVGHTYTKPTATSTWFSLTRRNGPPTRFTS
jgi:hypothetical protein